MTNNTSPIIAKVCKHANYAVSKIRRNSDLTCVKITNIHEDGSRSNTFIAIPDYKQPWWIVKDTKRNFKQPKDYIEESMVREYKTPRCRIPFEAKKQLFGVADHQATMRDAKASQFAFGLDQTPPVHIKQAFFKKYGEYQEQEAYTVASYDVEADMEWPTDHDRPMIMGAVTMKDKAYLAAVRSFYKGDDDATILTKLAEAEVKYMGQRLDKRKCKVTYELFDTPGQVAKACLDKMHEWEPDWVVSWNAEYDMNATERALRNEGYDLEDCYSDPRIPKEFRYYKLDLGRTHKTKEDGSSSPLEPQEKWPTVRTMATWQWIDGMSFYCIKRQPSEGKLPAISLEFCAGHAGVEGKLYTEEGAHLLPGSPQWHRFMQRNYPYLYSQYCVADNIVIEEINEKTNDYSLSLPMLLKFSEFFNYVSQPKLISDTLSFFARELGYVWGSTPAIREKTFTDRLPGLGNWIALLDTEKNASVGKALFEGLMDVISTGRTDSSDIDVEGAYPHGTLCLNVSNKTTQIEAYKIQGADDEKFREIGVNYASSAEANAIQLCHDLFRFPEADTLKEVFERVMRETGREAELAEIQASKRPRKARRNVEVEEIA